MKGSGGAQRNPKDFPRKMETYRRFLSVAEGRGHAARRDLVADQRGRHDGRVTVPKRPRPTPGRHVGSGGD